MVAQKLLEKFFPVWKIRGEKTSVCLYKERNLSNHRQI